MPPIEIPATTALEALLAFLRRDLDALKAQGLRRQVRSVEAIDGVRMRVDGRNVVCWCSNDYLGLAAHPSLIEASSAASRKWGTGARASRLLSGTTECHRELEKALAGWFRAESAIVFASGYLANHGALTALLDAQDAVLADRLAHASLIDAAKASGATLRIFRHNDTGHLDQVLGRVRGRRKLVVTEGVFSMDGDRAPLKALLDTAQRRGALLYLDDAHGAFVAGPTGRGTPEAFGVDPSALLYMGTLGKALGAQGGFLVGPSDWIEWLRNRARSWIYATALSVPAAAAALSALKLLEQGTTRQEQLRANADSLFARLQGHAAIPQGTSATHILPWITGSPASASAAASRLWDAGIWCPAIRPPTVPKNTSRLRLSVTALHSEQDIEHLVSVLTHS